MEIKAVVTDDDILRTWEVMHLLRPHLKEDEYLKTIRQLISGGYSMAFIEENGRAVSVIGFRHLQFLFNGRHIYIDDLSTLAECRGRGFGSALLDYVSNLAREKGYLSVTLDSGPARQIAHRLYINKGFVMTAYHFSQSLNA